jgi:phosphate transport system substrate-binding protein
MNYQCPILQARGSRALLCAVGILSAFSLSTSDVHAAELRIGGAGTTLGTMRELGKAYEEANRGTTVTVDKESKGSPGGVRALLRGDLDVAVSTRKLTDADVEGVNKLLATEIARVPFVFAVNAETRETEVTSAELLQIYQEKKTTWSDGSRIVLVPRTAKVSDTLFLMDLSPEWRSAMLALDANPKIMKWDTAQEAAELVGKRRGALTTSTLALMRTESRNMKALKVDGVEPTSESVADGRYHYYKPVILLTASASARSPAVQTFVEFVCSPAGQKILARTGHVFIAKKNEKC